jgi:hypothetical protein
MSLGRNPSIKDHSIMSAIDVKAEDTPSTGKEGSSSTAAAAMIGSSPGL